MHYYLKALKNYVDFNGRARRSEFWYFTLFNFLIYVGLLVISYVIGTSFLFNLYCLAVLLPSIAVGIRRMHDVGKSGWFVLIPVYSLILAVTEGDDFENEYGQDPKEWDALR
ncbi:DUF805 domain-containing protein [Chondrinema litorale]|uniref:DUF805 domain-containing protein n=1 Tax=Chondrinema litorale TaxID=2994555 RepID=UPI002543EF9F|nr:DUF805 domain-containing protein [Chondrinema litorale]UZR93469.1 DUF805 domain-containing protein [Chondrinema litorale]